MASPIRFRTALLLCMCLGIVPTLDAALLPLVTNGTVRQSSDLSATNLAGKAADGLNGSYSATLNTTGGYWEVEFRRTYPLTRIELVAPTAPALSSITSGLDFRIHDVRDHVVFSTVVTNPGAGGTWAVDLPTGLNGRILRFGLESDQLNGAGNRQVALGEVRAYGDPSPAFGPLYLGAVGSATQTTSYAAANGAHLAVDGNPQTYSMTTNTPDGFWQLSLDRARPLHRIELANRIDASAARLANLTLRVLDDASNTVASATVTNPGLGATWGHTLPDGTTGRYVRIGLEGGMTNGAGDFIVQLAEVSVLTASNLALNRDAFMVRYLDTLPPATNANDGNLATSAETSSQSVDAYWEVDLGQTYALYGIRTVSGNGFATRVAHCTARLFDQHHESVFSRHFTNSAGTFETDLEGPVLARYVRIGLENKERTAAGVEWYLNFKEVQVFGRPAADVGLLSIDASSSNTVAGGPVTLSWTAREMLRLDLHPGLESVGASMLTADTGSLIVAPTASVEYVLVGTNRSGIETRAVAILVSNVPLPLRIGEFVTDNNVSLEDGNGDASDWIELHNPNNTPADLTGMGLSDDPLLPMKWTFPATNIPPHGHVLVFASGSTQSVDAAGCLHANFQLASAGDSIVLTASNGATIVDALTNYPAQRDDLSYGRTLQGAWAFLEPTPGAFNVATSYTGWLAPVAFSTTRGFYTNAFTLAISNGNPGATVYYSINGSVPTQTYVGPLTVASTMCVRADVRQTDYKSPRTKTHSYIFTERVATAGYMNAAITLDTRYTNRLRKGLAELPSISISVPVLPDDYIEREASMELFLPGQPDPIQMNCGFHRFGGAWTTFAKKSYRMQFRKQYGDAKLKAPLFSGFDHGFLAEDTFDAIDLHGGSHDMKDRGFYMSSAFVQDTMLDMGSLNPHSRFVNVYLNGTYWGQYHAREQLVDAFLAQYLGGPKTNYLTVRGNDNAGTSFIPGTPDPPNRYPWERVRALRNSYQSVRPYLDVTGLVDFMLMWFYGSCETEYRSAGPVDTGSGFKFWCADADGHLRAGSTTGNNTASTGPGGLFGALTAESDPDFKMLLADRIQRHFFRDGALTPASCAARLDARMAEITNSLVAECARWSFQTPASWEATNQLVHANFFPLRTTNLFGYLRARGFYPTVDPPQLNHYGGSVTSGFPLALSAANGTIYYTLDGSDPRLSGGAVAPGAFSTNAGDTLAIAPGSTWRYSAQGSLPATNWHQPAYGDTNWLAGPAELGFGDGGEATTIAGGPSGNRYSAHYFRQAFTVPNPAVVTQLLVNLMRDDGAVVYLNGAELFRDNMPTGTIQYATLAAASVNDAAESTYYTFTVRPTNLVAGTNLLAVEIHQANLSSSDTSFNVSLQFSTGSSPLTLPLLSNTVLRARVLSGTNWSALIEADFYTASIVPLAGDDVLISEIHYDPDGSDDYEFIELYNRGSNLVHLGGARLGGGVDFLFPAGFYLAPGQFTVVVEDAPSFAARYQSTISPWFYPGIRVAGTWAGRLANEGEMVSLIRSNAANASVVDYKVSGAWPSRAAGVGSSLEVRSVPAVPTDLSARNAYLAEGANWRSSSLYHGSPGRLDDYTRPVEIHEVLSHTDADTDWIELRNPGQVTNDLSGLYVSDTYAQPFRFRLTNGTSIPPGGYLLLSTSQLGFAFSELGSDALIVAAQGTNLWRFVDTVDFPAAAREESFGRYTRSDSQTDFTELRAITKGFSNALPRVGPVVITEIMYRPATNRAEFVELMNFSTGAIAFHDLARPTNRWSLSGGVSYLFPTGLVVAPCSPLIVCATSPVAFRAQYGLSTNIPVYGPWTGSLNNAGDSLKLRRPGDPEPDGSVPQYRVDRVAFEPVSPWPLQANSGGRSLERQALEAYGNDPANWAPSSLSNGTPGFVAGNRPPTVGVTGSQVIDEGDTVLLSVLAADADLPWQSVALLGATNLPPGCVFDATNGTLSWATFEADGPSTTRVAFVARDSSACGGMTATTLVALVVNEVNQPPVLGPTADIRYPAAISLRRIFSATDPDAPAQGLTFAETGLPAGLSLNPASGWLEGIVDTPGNYVVQVSVADDQIPPLSDQRSFLLAIDAPFDVWMGGMEEGTHRIVFQAMSNQTYEVQFCDVMDLPLWQTLAHVSNAPAGPSELLDTTATQRFYRIIWHEVQP